MMTTGILPSKNENQRMEQELWTLTLKGDDIEAYNNRFHKLVLMCPELVPTKKKKIEKRQENGQSIYLQPQAGGKIYLAGKFYQNANRGQLTSSWTVVRKSAKDGQSNRSHGEDCRVSCRVQVMNFLQNVNMFSGVVRKEHFKDQVSESRTYQNDGARGELCGVEKSTANRMWSEYVLLNDHYHLYSP
ncbi:hypothetical protein Tco_1218217 [Tanacetum coccineum]